MTDTTGLATGWRYIESMYRLGYTNGSVDTGDGQRRFCPAASANLLGSPGTSGIRAVNLILNPVSARNSGPVDLAIVAPTPTPTNTATNTPTHTPTNTPTSTQTPDPRVVGIPTLSPGMLGMLVAGLAALALLLLRRS